ncbi:hypothetical protein KL935_000164 [Ogataea polymorpha]|nr:hypothetical protein KL908_000739 [Ogataea polymorpha]KAG7904025.1 hypothetical protein KL935_000164 [Ogataea polymorpha]KAG7908472.1 hypothetical protein KL907_001962 [Ogataea polymorpha]KAG7939446.1 hypothetical protein KL934_000380 [Ogataea polymorpha]
MGVKRAAPEATGPEFQFEVKDQWRALRGLIGQIDDSISQLEPEQKKYKSDEEPAKESGEEHEDDSEPDNNQKEA